MKRISIRLRLALIMICLTTLPVMIVTTVAATNTRNSVENEIISSNNARMISADQYLDELINQINALFYSLQINQQLMSSLSEVDSPDISAQFRAQNFIRDTLNTALYSNAQRVDDLTLYIHADGRAFSVNLAGSTPVSFMDISTGDWSRMLEQPINMYFTPTNGIHAFHSINGFENHQLIGGLSVQISRRVWSQVSEILHSEANTAIWLLNDQGTVLSGPTDDPAYSGMQALLRSLDPQDPGPTFRRTTSSFYFIKRVGGGQLTVVKAIPLATVSQSTRATIRAGFWTGGLFAAVSVVAAILLSLRISQPIVRLAQTIRTTHSADFDVPLVQSHDEIGLLESSYHSMIQRIKELIAAKYQREIDLKNAQLKALQAQINPHFLNNSLNLIGGMALAKGAPEIYPITRAIGDLLRYAISTDDDLVTLADELKHTKNYIYVQENRFAGRCTVAVTADDSVLETRLPRFTLQPVVENAFEHGLQRKEGAWGLELHVKRIGRNVAILVKDDGVGVPAERLQQLRSEMRGDTAGTTPRGPSKRRSIGLQNVNSRLKLHFGDRYRIRIFSQPVAGTLIVIALPMAGTEVGSHAASSDRR